MNENLLFAELRARATHVHLFRIPADHAEGAHENIVGQIAWDGRWSIIGGIVPYVACHDGQWHKGRVGAHGGALTFGDPLDLLAYWLEHQETLLAAWGARRPSDD
jgi:hypothetical protein